MRTKNGLLSAKPLIWVFVLAILAFGIVLISAQDTIKVGILHSLSGTMSISETTVRDSTLMAIEEINAAGGVLGRMIEPIVEDGASDWPLHRGHHLNPLSTEPGRLRLDESRRRALPPVGPPTGPQPPEIPRSLRRLAAQPRTPGPSSCLRIGDAAGHRR